MITKLTRTAAGVWAQSGSIDSDIAMGERMDGTYGITVSGRLPIDADIAAAVPDLLTKPVGTTIEIGEPDADNSAEMASYWAHRDRMRRVMGY